MLMIVLKIKRRKTHILMKMYPGNLKSLLNWVSNSYWPIGIDVEPDEESKISHFFTDLPTIKYQQSAFSIDAISKKLRSLPKSNMNQNTEADFESGEFEPRFLKKKKVKKVEKVPKLRSKLSYRQNSPTITRRQADYLKLNVFPQDPFDEMRASLTPKTHKNLSRMRSPKRKTRRESPDQKTMYEQIDATPGTLIKNMKLR